MDIKEEHVFKNEHPRDLIHPDSLLKGYRFTESLEFDQSHEGIPPTSVTAGARRSSEPNVAFQEITVRPGQNIQQALDTLNEQGGGLLKLVAGTHTVNSDIIVYSGITIRGESTSNTTVDFNSSTGRFVLAGTNIYTIGSIDSTVGTTVNGLGTTWTSNMVGRQLFIDNRWYLIVAFISTTQIIIESAYADGASYTGTYRIVAVVKDVEFEELTIKNSTRTAITCTDVRDLVFEDITLVSNSQGASFTNFMAVDVLRVPSVASSSNGWQMTSGSFFNARGLATIGNGGHGMLLNTVKISTILDSASNANADDGYNCTTVTKVLFTVEASSNQGQGIELVSGCDNNTFLVCVVQNNTSDGIKLTASNDSCCIGIGCTITGNGASGINIAAGTCDNNIIIGSQFSGNTTAAVTDLGTTTLIRSNRGVADN
jgi:hypothetical protein